MERLAARHQRIGRTGIEREADPAIVPEQLEITDHHAAAPGLAQALDHADRPPLPVDDAQPHGVALGRRRQGERLGAAEGDAARHAIEHRPLDIGAGMDGHIGRVGDMAVAQLIGRLDRLDQLMQRFEVEGRFDAARLQPVEQAGDHQGGQALGRRRRVIEGRPRHRQRQRAAPHRAMARHVVAGDRTAERAERLAEMTSDLAPIKIVEAFDGEMAEQIGELRLGQDFSRHLPPAESGGEAGLPHQRRAALAAQRGGDDRRRGDARAGVMRRLFEQARQRQAPVPARRDLQRRLPARQHAGHGGGGQRPDTRHLLEPLGAVDGLIGAGSRRARGVDADRRAAGLVDQPEPVAGQAVHMRIDHGAGGAGGQRRLDGVATLAQDGQAGLRRQVMRRGHHAAQGHRRIVHGWDGPAQRRDCQFPRMHIFGMLIIIRIYRRTQIRLGVAIMTGKKTIDR